MVTITFAENGDYVVLRVAPRRYLVLSARPPPGLPMARSDAVLTTMMPLAMAASGAGRRRGALEAQSFPVRPQTRSLTSR